jgi:hypothetical protein
VLCAVVLRLHEMMLLPPSIVSFTTGNRAKTSKQRKTSISWGLRAISRMANVPCEGHNVDILVGDYSRIS